jgi:hypothetical protein
MPEKGGSEKVTLCDDFTLLHVKQTQVNGANEMVPPRAKTSRAAAAIRHCQEPPTTR